MGFQGRGKGTEYGRRVGPCLGRGNRRVRGKKEGTQVVWEDLEQSTMAHMHKMPK